jgi:O-methyltransferase
MESLEHVYPRLSRGAVVVVDDYCDPSVLERNNILPGAKKACDEFLAGKPEKMTVLIAGPEAHAYFRKM